MNDLEMIKALAELEGIKLTREVYNDAETGEAVEWFSYLPSYQCFCSEEYNPITDLALNCAARDKYGVTIHYYLDGTSLVSLGCIIIDVEDLKNVPRSVVEVILRLKGLRKE